MSIPVVTQELIDNTNTEAIQKNALAISVCLTSIQDERDRAIQAEHDTLTSANYYTDTAISQSLTSSVKSVNGIYPDTTGNITVDKVKLADNIYTSDFTVDNPDDGYIFRTAGGDASITNGDSYLSQIRGNTILQNGLYISAKPLTFSAAGFNQFNPNSVIAGFNKIDGGKIVADPTGAMRVGYVHVAGGLSKGYTIHSKTGSIITVGWCAGVPALNTDVEIVTLEATEDSTVEGCKNYKYTRKADGNIFDDGYLCIVFTDASKICVHPHWSGPANWRDEGLEDYTTYSTSTISIPLIDNTGASLPLATYGVPSVNAVYDEYDFTNGKYYKRIGRKDFTPENLAYVQSYGTAYIEDGSTSIYYILKESDKQEFNLPNSFSNLYTVCDYGTEEFLGTTVPVKAKLSYVPNLRDKLRTDVVTISEQSLTDVQKERVQSNLNVVDASEVTKSVNGFTPDEHGNVEVEKVEFANNLYSTDNIADKDAFIFRTAGGSQSINSGMAQLGEVRGNIIDPIHINESIEFTKSEKQRFIMDVNKPTWIASPFGGSSGTYTFIREGGVWKYLNVTVDLATYGITLTPIGSTTLNVIDGDKLTVYYTIYGEGEEAVYSLEFSKVEASHLKITFSKEVFRASDKAIAQTKGTSHNYVFIYMSTTGWQCDGVSIAPKTLVDYGITLDGTPTNNDSITVAYTKLDLGKIYIATPTSFKSVCQNQFNRDTMYLKDYTINDSGKIVPETGKYVAYAYVTGSISQDDERGYTVYNSFGGITKVGYTKNLPVAGLEGINLGMTYVDQGGKSWNLPGEYVASFDKLVNIHGFEDDGYICVATNEIKHLNIHPRWSGYENLSFYVYKETTLQIPETGTIKVGEEEVTVDLPTKTYGIPRVADVYDVLNLDKHTYTKNIGKEAYSESKLAEIAALTDVYVYDDTIILYKLTTPVVYKIAETFGASYEVDDFGTERYYGTSVPVNTVITYGDNLRDKLRTDVVTYSNQDSLNKTEAQKAQARKNIGACSDAETIKSVNSELPDTKGNVLIRKVALAENIYSSDNVSNLEYFYVRTSGGDASISNGNANLSYVLGNIEIDSESGAITIAKPTQFKSIGFNAFNKNTMIISGYNTFGTDGKIKNDPMLSGYKLCYARMPVSDNRGWQMYNPDGAIIKVGWCKEIPTATSTITLLDKNTILSEANNDVYVHEETGYLIIVTTDVNTLCVHPRWSGRSNWHDAEGLNDYETYTDNVIVLPKFAKDGTALPLNTYGFPGIGGISDTIDFIAKQYVKKIAYLPYTEENLEYAYENSETVIYDTEKILYVLKNFITYDIEVENEYEVCDYGTEMFEGTEIELKTEITYGDNLRDKLRTDVVTYSNQDYLNKSAAQKKTARDNIGALGIGEGITSVNGVKPASNGNVTLNEVPYANNLLSTDNQEIKSHFIFRTAGGDASITNGNAYLSYITGYANNPQHVEEVLTLASSEMERLNPTIDKDTWIAGPYGQNAGTYDFSYGTKWTYYNKESHTTEDVILADVGITIMNYPLAGDKLTVVYTIETVEGETVKTVSISATEKPHFGASLDNAVFKASALGTSSNQYKFIYESLKWNVYKLYNNTWTSVYTDVNPSTYGVTINGTPIQNDRALINYTKKYDESFIISKPSSFKAVGFNQFNKGSDEFPSAQTLVGYSIDASGNIVPTAGKTVAYVHVVGGLSNGYQVFNGLTAIDKIYWNPTIPTTTTTGLALALVENETLSEDSTIAPIGNKLIKDYQFDNDGYIVLSASNVDNLCVHPRWSGTVNWRDSEGFKDYEEYFENSITIPTSGYDTTGVEPVVVDLPTKTYGIPSVGDVSDRLDFDNLTYTQNISCLDYSAQHLSDVVSLGVPYSYDNTYILFQMENPKSFKLEDTISNVFQSCDYGTEEFTGTTVETYNGILYGQSLKDKLRTDVLTISEQSLSDSEKDQAKLNLGMRYNLVVKELVDATVRIAGTDIAAKVCVADDFAINTVEVTGNEKPVYIYLPSKSKDGRARDFIVRVAVTSATAPSISFIGQNEEIDYESTDDEWATIESGSNLFAFTETLKENA